MLNDIIQFIIAIVIITLLGVVSYSIYNAETRRYAYSLTQSVVVKKEVPVFQGIVGSKTTFSYNTQNKKLGNYRELIPSINQDGGAEYTYNFWLFIPENNDKITQTSLPLFLRGSNMKPKYNTSHNCDAVSTEGWYMVKNPLVKLILKDNKVNGIVTEYNSITAPDAFHANPEPTNCSQETRYDNMLGIYGLSDRSDISGKWNMVTLVVQETNPSSDILFRNKANIKMYFNGYQYLDKHAEISYNGDNMSTAMKHNKGKLYVFPTAPNTSFQMADLTYFNYAIEKDKVLSLFNQGFTKIGATIPNENEIQFNSETSGVEYEKSKNMNEY